MRATIPMLPTLPASLGGRILAAGLAKTWQLWNPNEDKPFRTQQGHNDYIYRAVFNQAGNRVATIGYAGSLYVWDANDGKQLFYQKLPVTAGYSLSYAPDGKEVTCATQDRRALIVTLPANAQ